MKVRLVVVFAILALATSIGVANAQAATTCDTNWEFNNEGAPPEFNQRCTEDSPGGGGSFWSGGWGIAI